MSDKVTALKAYLDMQDTINLNICTLPSTLEDNDIVVFVPKSTISDNQLSAMIKVIGPALESVGLKGIILGTQFDMYKCKEDIVEKITLGDVTYGER